jgi:hypothetical protein
MLTVSILLIVTAFITTILSALGKCPLWISVVLLCVLELINHLPVK